MGYSDQWCNYLSAQVHEVGHNMGYGHSNEVGTYKDQTGMMGYSYSQDDGPVMCFNAAKSHQTGWYADEVTVVTPDADGDDGCFDDQVYGVADYSNGQNDQTVIVRVDDPSADDYFIAYNRKTGINSGTVEGGNTVTVQRQGANGASYAESELLAKLNAGNSYTISANNMIVTFVETATSNGVQSARVRVSLNGEQCEGRTPNPTNQPTTAQPTSSPTPMPPCQLDDGGDGVTLQVNLKTDMYPAETTWSLTRTCSGTESIASGSGYSSANTEFSTSYCVQDGKFEFTMNDAYGDGICCSYGEGNYSVLRQGTVEVSGGQFGGTETTSFGSETDCDSSGPVTPPPSSPPSSQPSNPPSNPPTNQPSNMPTGQPSNQPTNQPSNLPTTSSPSKIPTANPTVRTNAPSTSSTVSSRPAGSFTSPPTSSVTSPPTDVVTAQPTSGPTTQPTSGPTAQPSNSPTLVTPLTDFPTSMQPTYLPTENPTTSSPLEATTQRTLRCGLNNKCSENEKTVEKTDVHAVRCCRDESHGGSGGWPFKCKNDSEATYNSSSGPWGQSRMGSIPDDIVGSVTNTCVETDFDGAVKTCEADNARLCTPREMSDRCTRGTGCNFNTRLVWTCIAGGDGCSENAECCSGTCGADGTCAAVVEEPPLDRDGCCSWEGKDCSSWIPENNPDCQYKQSDCENNCGGNWQLF